MKNNSLYFFSLLAFVVLVCINIKICNEYSQNGSQNLTILKLVALAQTGSENCVADDPGECVAEARNCNLCCVGESGNCTASHSWVDCGEGAQYCQ